MNIVELVRQNDIYGRVLWDQFILFPLASSKRAFCLEDIGKSWTAERQVVWDYLNYPVPEDQQLIDSRCLLLFCAGEKQGR